MADCNPYIVLYKPSIYRLLTLTKLNFFGDQLDD